MCIIIVMIIRGHNPPGRRYNPLDFRGNRTMPVPSTGLGPCVKIFRDDETVNKPRVRITGVVVIRKKRFDVHHFLL